MMLADRVLAALHRHDLLPQGGTVLVALSGGGDSVALLHLLRDLREHTTVRIAGAAHLNHRLRAAADEDERFCRDLAARLDVPIVVEHADVAALARARAMSIEEAGHHARKEFLARAAAALAADAVATGHTRDDQAETFLLRLIRGAGARGLAGIHPRAGCFIRPLLDISRAELREYLAARGIAYREDESNEDVAVVRNRIRHRLIPHLRDQWSDAIVDVLARNAAIARDDADELDRQASELATSIVLVGDEAIELDADLLRALPPALGRRLALRALASRPGAGPIGYEHVARLLDLSAAREGAAVDLPRQRATRQGSRIVLTAPLPRGPGIRVPGSSSSLPVPGETAFGDEWVISAERSSGVGDPAPAGPSGTDLCVAVSGEVDAPLTVRARRPGDALRPVGLRGRKKLQDLFTDRKVPRPDRDGVPLVVDARDRIVWVVGHAISEDFRVTDRGAAVVILKARKAQGARKHE